MAIVNKFNVNGQVIDISNSDITANNVSYDDSFQYDENTVGDKLSEINHQMIYDVTANNDGTTFDSLSALLSDENLSTLIPTSVRHGGMRIQFIQSSDNKYVQYILRKVEWSVNKDDWEEINTKSGKYFLMTFGTTVGYIPLLSINEKITLSDANPSIGVSNLINVNKTVPQIIQLSNLWSSASAAPSYVITDENLTALQVVSGVSTATIDSTNLPEEARFLIANSENKNGVIGTSNLPTADSGIPLYVALKLLPVIPSASLCNSSNYFVNNSVQIGSYLSGKT